jgi:hypothetical protein
MPQNRTNGILAPVRQGVTSGAPCRLRNMTQGAVGLLDGLGFESA